MITSACISMHILRVLVSVFEDVSDRYVKTIPDNSTEAQRTNLILSSLLWSLRCLQAYERVGFAQMTCNNIVYFCTTKLYTKNTWKDVRMAVLKHTESVMMAVALWKLDRAHMHAPLATISRTKRHDVDIDIITNGI